MTVGNTRAREPLAPLPDREQWAAATFAKLEPWARRKALDEYRANNSKESADRVEREAKAGAA